MSKAQKGWKRGFWALEHEGMVYLFDGKEKQDDKGVMVAPKKPTRKDLESDGWWWCSDLSCGRFFDHVSADLRSLLSQQLDGQTGALFVHLFVDLQSEVPVAVVSE